MGNKCCDGHNGGFLGRCVADWISIAIVTVIALAILGSCEPARASELVIDMDAIMMIESGGQADVVNKRSGAIGLYQVTPICLSDYNRHATGLKYTKNDLLDPQINAKVAYWYMNERIPQMLRASGLVDNTFNRILAYNAGIGKARRGEVPDETKVYMWRYLKLTGAK